MTDVHTAGSSDEGSAPATAAGAVHSPLPFSAPLTFLDAEDIAMLDRLGKKIPRTLMNDGGMMIRDANGHGIAIVLCQTPFKRGEGSRAECTNRDELADFIVRACNSHYELVAALKAIVALDDGDRSELWAFEDEFNAARAALSKVQS